VLVTPVLHHGGSLVIIKSFCAKIILNLIEEEHFTLFMGVPTMLKMMSEEPQFKKTDFSSLMYCIVGGEAMPIPLIEVWKKQGVLIRQGYGLTEVGPNLTSLHQDDAIRKKGSIGRPNFYVQTKIVDENGVEVGKNQKGELLLKGPMVSPGYWKNEQATNESLKDGWFYTGDVVIRDEEDYLFVVDRIKNMFISGGENVYPAEIERVLQEHPAIFEVAVIGVAHEKWGEVGKAFVVASEKSLTQKEILDYCKIKLAKFKIPKYIEFIKEIPKNDTGKIDRKLLKNK
jgi:fatty-acyl-CoA synthase